LDDDHDEEFLRPGSSISAMSGAKGVAKTLRAKTPPKKKGRSDSDSD
jgi:hypothetical protein